jgi:ligand-binding SRPBCC domain-containing protein
MHRFSICSDLAAPPEVVWRHVTAMDGVNDELKPLLRMTVPPGLRQARIDDLIAGRPAGRSWLLLLSALPVDYDDLTIAEHGPGHRFREESTMLTQTRWEHERVLHGVDGGCRIVDTLAWQGRTAALGALNRLAVPVLFHHRHRRLRRRFGVLPP